jgi:GTPase SAR1 family protein
MESYIIDVKNKCLCSFILIGNKSDLKREITFEEIESFSKRHNLKYFEISSKLNINVLKLFTYVAALNAHEKVLIETIEVKKSKACVLM